MCRRSDKRLQFAQIAKFDDFQFGQGIDRRDFAVAQEDRLPVVFVGQPVDMECALIAPGFGRVLRQAAIPQPHFAGNRARASSCS